MEKSDIYSLEKVNERISYYTELLASLKNEEFRSINQNILNFWTSYKLNNYPDEKTNS